MDQVDCMYPHLRRRSEVSGEALPPTEVGQLNTHCYPLYVVQSRSIQQQQLYYSRVSKSCMEISLKLCSNDFHFYTFIMTLQSNHQWKSSTYADFFFNFHALYLKVSIWTGISALYHFLALFSCHLIPYS